MDDTWVRWLLGGLGAVIVALFGDMFRRLFSRLDVLEARKANEESVRNRFDEMIGELRLQRTDFKEHQTEDREMHKDVLDQLRETNHHLSTTNTTLANLAGRFDATNGHR
jgi:uncharacterized membrane-anchored protein YhcB (DUF1043 family)